jgi:HSP20 family molecular chaperone IbpA
MSPLDQDNMELFADPFLQQWFTPAAPSRLVHFLGDEADPDQPMQDAPPNSSDDTRQTPPSDSESGAAPPNQDDQSDATHEDDGVMTTANARSGNWFRDFVRAPTMDVARRENEYLVTLDVPGVPKNDIKMSLTRNDDGSHTLTVSGERKSETKSDESNKNHSWCSTRYGSFSRSIRVPRDVDVSALQAKHEDGCLKVKLPRKEPEPEEDRTKSIEIE